MDDASLSTSAWGGLALALSAWSVLAASTRLAAQPAVPPEAVAIRLAPIADASVRAGVNYGDKEWLAIGGVSIQDTYYNEVRSSFLKFDTGAVERVSCARLRLYGAISSTAGGRWVDVRPTSDTSWEENRLKGTLTVFPYGDLEVGDPLDSVELPNDKIKRWHEWDVSEWVLQERTAGRNVLTLVLSGNNFAFFESRESRNNPPELVLIP